ncbi:MAG: tetratricopeptide repeat protein, partial [Candidatus Eremiobacterota bacterium]
MAQDPSLSKSDNGNKGKDREELFNGHASLGVLYAKEGHYERAIEELEKAIVINPSSPEIFANLGYIFLMIKEYDKAGEYLSRSLALNPSLSGAYCNLGVLYSRQGKLDEAISQFRHALEIDPTLAEAHINIAHIYGVREMYTEMKEECEKAIKIKPDCIQAYINFAYACGKLSRYTEGIKKIQQALRYDSSNAIVFSNLGVLYEETRQYNKAIESFRKAITIDPDYAEAYSNLGTIYYIKGDYVSSRDSFKKAVTLNKDLPQAKASLARICEEQELSPGEKKEILDLLDDVSETKITGEGAIIASEGISLAVEEDRELKNLEEAIRLNPDSPACYVNLGKYLFAHGNIDESIRHYQKAIRLDQTCHDGRYNLAISYEKKGLIVLAENEYKKLLKYDPANIQALSGIAGILFDKGDFEASIAQY